MINYTGSWLIHDTNSLEAMNNLYSRQFDGNLDLYRESFKERASYSKKDGYSVVNVHGAMVNKTDVMGEIYNIPAYENIVYDILQASNDDNEVLILDIDSVGGMVNGISTVIEAIKGAKTKKKIYAYVSGVAFSAGYWIASQADEIFLTETSQVGSIGAMIQYYKYDVEKFNIKEYRFISSVSPNKNPQEDTKEHTDDMQSIVDTAGFLFVDSVADARGTTRDKVISDFGQGRVFFAKEAIERGMADSIGSIQTIIERFNMTKKTEEAVDKSTVDAEAVAKEAVAKERQRIKAIQGHKNAGVQASLVEHFIEVGASAEDAVAILDKVTITSVAEEKKSETITGKLDALMVTSENNPDVKQIEGKLETPTIKTKLDEQDVKSIIKNAGIK